MTESPNQKVQRIATENFAADLGVEFLHAGEDVATVKLPYSRKLGVSRIHGGAISALIDIAATAAFWSTPLVNPKSMGATVGMTINFLKLAVETDLTATATIRRRGGTLCTSNVSVVDSNGDEIAIGVVTYKLTHA